MTRHAYIVDAVRTPIGRHAGALAARRADDLAADVIRGLLARHPDLDPAHIDDVVFGCANQAGEDNRNVARMGALLAGLPVSVPGQTVNRLCGSGLQAVVSSAHAIAAGEGDLFVAGGVESMSRAPFVMLKPERAYPRGVPETADSLLGWRFVNPAMPDDWTVSLGETAEIVGEEHGVDRQAQDAFALASHRRAVAAIEAGLFDDEVVPVEVPGRKGTTTRVTRDESPRPDTSPEALARLRAIFRRDGGTVTAGNASPLNDGASALLVASEDAVREWGLRPMARIVASAVAGVDPQRMGIGPVPATRKALARAGLEVDQLDLVELNEAFAAQSVACVEELGLDPDRVNVHGGAIALGHPLGASGARITTTLVHAMRRRQARYGLSTMCIGVGQGIACVLERVDDDAFG
jgi:3-oxoadipyl-CoA thiolase